MSTLFWLSDEAWAAIAPHIPKNQPGARRVDDRRVISGILHVLKSGCRWKDCPAGGTLRHDNFIDGSCDCRRGWSLVGLVLPMPVFASLDLDPLDAFREPKLQLDIVPRSGPIAILVLYEIEDDDLEDFLALMRERRRIRIRDGAQAWALMRDLQNPVVWTETYHTPTWVDYVRHNRRRTKADAENHMQLRKLHRGQDAPEIRRMIERQVIPADDDVFHQVQVNH